ncbi:hypothetical protein ACFPM7_14490 [Actinokineospora guangxiensis]|uniref:HEAT repeat protein n=1 Tax=Actinokineospora guangxiensis TaxID=1490288 RepID=A0ABW0EPK8_9PSEU
MLAGPAQAEIDWNGLSHAYDKAADTPGHLATLLDADAAVRARAMGHLWSAILHQGTVYPATAPAARVVAGLLADERAELELDGAPIRIALLRFLGEVAESTSYAPVELDTACPPGREDELRGVTAGDWEDEEEGVDFSDVLFEVMWSRAVAACRDSVGDLLAAVTPWLADPGCGRAARYAAVRLHKAGDVPTESITEHLRDVAVSGAPATERAEAVLALGDLQADTSGYLHDAEQVVRVCAALHATRDTAEILAGLLALPESDEWLVDTPYLSGKLRFHLVAAAVERVDDFADLLPAALHVLRFAGPFTVERDWGPLLGKALEGPADARRTFLDALIETEGLWDPRNGNASVYLRKLGLPSEREAFRAATA